VSRGLFRALCACLVAVAALGAVACVPQDKGAAREVADARSADPVPTPPKFPDTGPVPPELLVKGLLYDFTSVPNDLNLWVPPTDQATCAAQKIVSTLGAARLSELGYRPATSGASLNDIDLTAGERDSVAQLFQSCVDMTEGIAALLMGNGHMSSSAALCISKGLASKQLLAPFVEAWAFGRAVDPFKDDAALTEAILSYSAVCLNNGAFTWNDANLPGDDQVQGSGSSAAPTTSTVPGTPDGLSSRIPSTTTAP
jgi:hypothetical protein